jgi:hypothetical protein
VAPSEAGSEEPPTCLEFATLEQGLRCAAASAVPGVSDRCMAAL